MIMGKVCYAKMYYSSEKACNYSLFRWSKNNHKE